MRGPTPGMSVSNSYRNTDEKKNLVKNDWKVIFTFSESAHKNCPTSQLCNGDKFYLSKIAIIHFSFSSHNAFPNSTHFL